MRKALIVMAMLTVSVVGFAQGNPFVGDPWLMVGAYIADTDSSGLPSWGGPGLGEYTFIGDGTYEERNLEDYKVKALPLWVDKYSLEEVKDDSNFGSIVIGRDHYVYLSISDSRILLLSTNEKIENDFAFLLRGKDRESYIQKKLDMPSGR